MWRGTGECWGPAPGTYLVPEDPRIPAMDGGGGDRRWFLDAVPSIGNHLSLRFLKVKLRELSEFEAAQSVPLALHLIKADREAIAQAKSLLEDVKSRRSSLLRKVTYLAYGSLVYKFCSKENVCPEGALQPLHNLLSEATETVHKEEIILALKSLGNAGQVVCIKRITKYIPGFSSMASNFPLPVQAAAVMSLRNIAMNYPTKVLDICLRLFMDTQQHPVIRMIAAGLVMDNRPPAAMVMAMAKSLMKEDDVHVGSFVYYLMKRQSKSVTPDLQDVAAVCNMVTSILRSKYEATRNEFRSGFSYNAFSDSLMSGFESTFNIIHNPADVLPVAALGRLKAYFMGVFTDLFEIGYHAEGLQELLMNRHLYSPQSGLQNQKGIRDLLKKLHHWRPHSSSEALASVYLKMFGQEIIYHGLNKNSLESILEFLPSDKYNALRSAVKALQNGVDINWSKPLLSSENRLVVPTCVGLPLETSLYYASVTRAQIQAQAQFTPEPKDPTFFQLLQSDINLKSKFSLSMTKDIVFMIGVNTDLIQAGIELRTQVHLTLPGNVEAAVNVDENRFKIDFIPVQQENEVLSIRSKAFAITRNVEDLAAAKMTPVVAAGTEPNVLKQTFNPRDLSAGDTPRTEGTFSAEVLGEEKAFWSDQPHRRAFSQDFSACARTSHFGYQVCLEKKSLTAGFARNCPLYHLLGEHSFELLFKPAHTDASVEKIQIEFQAGPGAAMKMVRSVNVRRTDGETHQLENPIDHMVLSKLKKILSSSDVKLEENELMNSSSAASSNSSSSSVHTSKQSKQGNKHKQHKKHDQHEKHQSKHHHRNQNKPHEEHQHSGGHHEENHGHTHHHIKEKGMEIHCKCWPEEHHGHTKEQHGHTKHDKHHKSHEHEAWEHERDPKNPHKKGVNKNIHKDAQEKGHHKDKPEEHKHQPKTQHGSEEQKDQHHAGHHEEHDHNRGQKHEHQHHQRDEAEEHKHQPKGQHHAGHHKDKPEEHEHQPKTQHGSEEQKGQHHAGHHEEHDHNRGQKGEEQQHPQKHETEEHKPQHKPQHGKEEQKHRHHKDNLESSHKKHQHKGESEREEDKWIADSDHHNPKKHSEQEGGHHKPQGAKRHCTCWRRHKVDHHRRHHAKKDQQPHKCNHSQEHGKTRSEEEKCKFQSSEKSSSSSESSSHSAQQANTTKEERKQHPRKKLQSSSESSSSSQKNHGKSHWKRIMDSSGTKKGQKQKNDHKKKHAVPWKTIRKNSKTKFADRGNCTDCGENSRMSPESQSNSNYMEFFAPQIHTAKFTSTSSLLNSRRSSSSSSSSSGSSSSSSGSSSSSSGMDSLPFENLPSETPPTMVLLVKSFMTDTKYQGFQAAAYVDPINHKARVIAVPLDHKSSWKTCFDASVSRIYKASAMLRWGENCQDYKITSQLSNGQLAGSPAMQLSWQWGSLPSWLKSAAGRFMTYVPGVAYTMGFSQGYHSNPSHQVTVRVAATSPDTYDTILKTPELTFYKQAVPIPWDLSLGTRWLRHLHLIELTNLPKVSSMVRGSHEAECKVDLEKIVTFDGKDLGCSLSPTNCYTVIAQDCTNQLRFLIAMRKMGQGFSTFEMNIILGSSDIKIYSDASEEFRVLLNGMWLLLKNDTYINEKDCIRIHRNAATLTVKAPKNGVEQISFNGQSAKVQLSPLMHGKTCGLCGNADLHPQNDFQKPNRDAARSCVGLVHSWMLPENSCGSSCALGRQYIMLENELIEDRQSTCYSAEPVLTCVEGCRPATTAPMTVEFHCLPKESAMRLEDWQADPKVSSSEDLIKEVEAHTSCVCTGECAKV